VGTSGLSEIDWWNESTHIGGTREINTLIVGRAITGLGAFVWDSR